MKKEEEIEVGEFRDGIERVRMQILIKLSALLSAHAEKEKFKLMIPELHEYLQHCPQLTGLKEDYDKLMKESLQKYEVS